MARASKNIAGGAGEVRASVESVREKIVATRRQRTGLDRERVEISVAKARASEWVAHATAELMRRGFSPEVFTSPKYQGTPKLETDVLSLLAVAVQAEAISHYVGGLLNDIYGDTSGISEDARAAALARVEQELLDLEFIEEALIRSAEVVGFEILRRVDADPRAVLAPTEVLT